jgi:hypothetical protein
LLTGEAAAGAAATTADAAAADAAAAEPSAVASRLRLRTGPTAAGGASEWGAWGGCCVAGVGRAPAADGIAAAAAAAGRAAAALPPLLLLVAAATFAAGALFAGALVRLLMLLCPTRVEFQETAGRQGGHSEAGVPQIAEMRSVLRRLQRPSRFLSSAAALPLLPLLAAHKTQSERRGKETTPRHAGEKGTKPEGE